jgi:hypothetical protein
LFEWEHKNSDSENEKKINELFCFFFQLFLFWPDEFPSYIIEIFIVRLVTKFMKILIFINKHFIFDISKFIYINLSEIKILNIRKQNNVLIARFKLWFPQFRRLDLCLNSKLITSTEKKNVKHNKIPIQNALFGLCRLRITNREKREEKVGIFLTYCLVVAGSQSSTKHLTNFAFISKV